MNLSKYSLFSPQYIATKIQVRVRNILVSLCTLLLPLGYIWAHKSSEGSMGSKNKVIEVDLPSLLGVVEVAKVIIEEVEEKTSEIKRYEI